jgi:ABC-type transport system involved in multi-copper enzyme maturation permease subunit
MSAGAATSRLGSWRDQPWQLWWRQVLAVMRLDLARNFFSRRGIWIYSIAFAPAFIIFLHVLVNPPGVNPLLYVQRETEMLAVVFQFFVRLSLFFGCMGIFTWLFRGEVVQKTLHYYFLVPMRREVLTVGKFLSGWITAAVMFGGSFVICFVLTYLHAGPAGVAFVLHGPGFGHLLMYLLVVTLACLGYGAMFLALSLIFRNPIVPGAILLGWETIGGILPSILQKLTVTYYLKLLVPVELPADGWWAIFTVVTEPIPPWAAVIGLVILSSLVVAYATRRVRHMSINYVGD